MEKSFKYLATANTSNGFVNHFDNINEDGSGFVYILKGGAGSGKSTLMKKIGEHFQKFGKVEYFYCSADIESLDAVRIVDKNITIVDGTSPHTAEPRIEGVTAKIVNLGRFIGRDILKYQSQIEKLLSQSKYYRAMYEDYLACAGGIYRNNMKLASLTLRNSKNKTSAKYVIDELSISKKNKEGKVRRFFNEYITLDGLQSLDKANNYTKIVELNNTPFANQKVFNKVIEKLLCFGYDVIVFEDIMAPENIFSISIPELDAIVVQAKGNLKLGDTVSSMFLANNQLLKIIIKNAGLCHSNASEAHKNIEKYYKTVMKFDGVNMITKELIEEIDCK